MTYDIYRRIPNTNTTRNERSVYQILFKNSGCLRVVDCWQDEQPQDPSAFHAEDARDEVGQPRSFREAADARSDEIVLFSWMEWPDKKTRDEGLAKTLADPRVQPEEGEVVIFEGRRLIASGFNVIVDL